MADATTPNYGWTLPTVGADSNTWGTILNTDLGQIDTDLKGVATGAVPVAGGEMTGTLTISAGTAEVPADYLLLVPTDAGVGKMGLSVLNQSATEWVIAVSDGTTQGTLNFGVSALMLNGSNILTAANLGATLTAGNVVGALGYTPVQTSNPDGIAHVIKLGWNGTFVTAQVDATSIPLAPIASPFFTGNVTMPSFTVTSERFLKSNIRDLEDVGTTIDRLQLHRFIKDGRDQAGVIVDEVIEIAPEAVSPAIRSRRGERAVRGVYESQLLYMALREIQSLRQRLAEAGL
jgi:hypothetical protein